MIRFFLSCLLAFLISPSLAHADSPKKNVLLIAVDDLTCALGCYGDEVAVTPHIDALAAKGIRFENAYNQCPLCNPSRASILTGLRPDQTKVYDLEAHFRYAVPDAISLPQLFKQHGWYSARVGKLYHYDVPFGIGTNGLDDPASWQQVVNPKGRDTMEEALIFNAEPHRKISGALSWLAADGADEEQTDGMVATETIRLMKERKDEPFFLGAGFYRPHTPYVAPKKYFDLYPMEKIRMPDAPADDREDIPVAAFAHNNPVPNYNLPVETCLKAKQAYYACVSFVDAQVGRLMSALDELGLAENTIIVFWSDHGYHLGEHQGIWQKRTMFEESASQPFIIYDPDAAGNGTACERVVEFVDLYPTLAELAGLEVPESMPLTGRSLVPLLKNPKAEWNGNAVSQILRPADDRLPTQVMGRSIRTERWRYTEWNGGESGAELYDHEKDPHEFTNLAVEPAAEAKAVIDKLKPLLEEKAQAMPPESPVNPERL
ncbi:MAG: sulfatase [Verrucomicrobiae bacterium]|nr:sulfatase [Verrucomicrobiae bacterium]